MKHKEVVIAILRRKLKENAAQIVRIKKCECADDRLHKRQIALCFRSIVILKKVITALKDTPKDGMIALLFIGVRTAIREERKRRCRGKLRDGGAEAQG